MTKLFKWCDDCKKNTHDTSECWGPGTVMIEPEPESWIGDAPLRPLPPVPIVFRTTPAMLRQKVRCVTPAEDSLLRAAAVRGAKFIAKGRLR